MGFKMLVLVQGKSFFQLQSNKSHFCWIVEAILLFKIKSMRSDSNTGIYIIAGVILLHFVVGFIWLAIKMTKKKDDSVEN